MIKVVKRHHILINNFILLTIWSFFLMALTSKIWHKFSIAYTQQLWLIQLRSKIWNMKCQWNYMPLLTSLRIWKLTTLRYKLILKLVRLHSVIYIWDLHSFPFWPPPLFFFSGKKDHFWTQPLNFPTSCMSLLHVHQGLWHVVDDLRACMRVWCVCTHGHTHVCAAVTFLTWRF